MSLPVTINEAAAIHAALPPGNSFMVVDLSTADQISVAEYFPRTWAPYGIAARAYPISSDEPAPFFDDILGPEDPGPLPAMVLVIDESREAADLATWLEIAERHELTYYIVKREHRRLRLEKDFLKGVDPAKVGTVKFSVSPANSLVLPCDRLPARVDVITGPDAGRNSRFRLEMDGSEHSVPAPSWIRLYQGGLKTETPVTVEIDIRLHRDGSDQWLIKAEGAGNEDIAIVSENPPVVDNSCEVAVIFDRTCPDQSSLDAAYEYSLPLRKEDLDGSHFNIELRAGLLPALEGAFQDMPGVRFRLCWFADNAEAKFYPLNEKSLDHRPNIPWGEFAGSYSIDQSNFKHHIQSLTWIAGLDLFDPVEESLNEVISTDWTRKGSRRAVLIIGNSPPNLDRNRPDEAKAIQIFKNRTNLNLHFRGFGKGNTFSGALKKARQQGIPVAWAFIDHNPVPGWDVQLAANLANVTRDVHSALKSFEKQGLLLDSSHPASAQGLVDAVAEAVEAIMTAWKMTDYSTLTITGR